MQKCPNLQDMSELREITELDCRIRRITLSDYGYRTVIFLPSNYRNIEYRIGEFKLSDIGSRPQSIGLSDIGLRKNYRLPTSGFNVIMELIRDH
jgi:hypothetical protein